MKSEEILDKTKNIPGWASEKTRKTLLELAGRSFSKGAELLVEVGTWEGRTAIPLGLEAKEYGHQLICSDPYKGFEESLSFRDYGDGSEDGEFGVTAQERFISRLHRFEIYPFVDLRIQEGLKTAYELASNPNCPSIGLVYIDGNHEDGNCFFDLCVWSNLVMPGGYLVVHDAHTHALPVSGDCRIWFGSQESWRHASEMGRNIFSPKRGLEELYIFQKKGDSE